MILLMLSAVLSSALSQKAILVDSSLGFYNYRQVSNIVKLYHHLRSNGYRDEDILLFIGELQPCC
jgi:phosphatidylinositol glycan class K